MRSRSLGPARWAVGPWRQKGENATGLGPTDNTTREGKSVSALSVYIFLLDVKSCQVQDYPNRLRKWSRRHHILLATYSRIPLHRSACLYSFSSSPLKLRIASMNLRASSGVNSSGCFISTKGRLLFVAVKGCLLFMPISS